VPTGPKLVGRQNRKDMCCLECCCLRLDSNLSSINDVVCLGGSCHEDVRGVYSVINVDYAPKGETGYEYLGLASFPNKAHIKHTQRPLMKIIEETFVWFGSKD